jgi:hypothetical protein
MTINREEVENPVRVESIGVEQQGDMATIFERETGRMLLVNQVGLRILDLCDGAHSVSDISKSIEKEFDSTVESGQIQGDIRTFLDVAHEKGVLVWKRES